MNIYLLLAFECISTFINNVVLLFGHSSNIQHTIIKFYWTDFLVKPEDKTHVTSMFLRQVNLLTNHKWTMVAVALLQLYYITNTVLYSLIKCLSIKYQIENNKTPSFWKSTVISQAFSVLNEYNNTISLIWYKTEKSRNIWAASSSIFCNFSMQNHLKDQAN